MFDAMRSHMIPSERQSKQGGATEIQYNRIGIKNLANAGCSTLYACISGTSAPHAILIGRCQTV